MPKFKFEEIERLTGEGRLFPVYLIYGPEQHLIRLLVDKLTEVYRAESGAEVERCASKGIDASEVIANLKTVSMWSKGKLVIIDDAGNLSVAVKEAFDGYVGKASGESVLIFTSEKFDGRSKLYKSIGSAGAVVEIKAVYENQMPYWINRECRRTGKNISQDAALFMTELVGTDLGAMSGAVSKVALYVGERKTISLKDIETVLSDTSQKSIFDLTNAAGSRDLPRAANRLDNLIRNNESPVLVVIMLARHWRLLIKTKELLANRFVSDGDIAAKLRVNPFFAKDYINQSKKFSKRELVKGLKKIWSADIAVKSSRIARENILHNLIMGLIK